MLNFGAISASSRGRLDCPSRALLFVLQVRDGCTWHDCGCQGLLTQHFSRGV